MNRTFVNKINMINTKYLKINNYINNCEIKYKYLIRLNFFI